MKGKLYVLSTDVNESRGGIASSIKPYLAKSNILDYEVIFIPTHSTKSKAIVAVNAIINLRKNLTSDDTVWLHCGQWFSMIRKLIVLICILDKKAYKIVHFHSQSCEAYLGSFLFSKIIKLLFRFSDHILVVSDYWKRLFTLSQGTKKPISVLLNTIDGSLVKNLNSRDRENRYHVIEGDKEVIKIVSMSRLVDGKGFEALIECFASLPENYSLSIIGDGPMRPRLAQLITDLELTERVVLKGWLSGQEKYDVISEGDIFCLLSTFDSFGMVYLEASALGLPVIALDYEPISEIVIDHVTGIRIKEAEPHLLQAHIQYCRDNREVILQRSRNLLNSKFSFDVVVKDLECILNDKHRHR
jgi:glycosyltransferase involved in cell wall biosynthesis